MRLNNDMQDSDPQEREISLGTATILGIFLALALVCAAFFGFGYSMGRHSTPPAAVVSTPAPDTKTDATDSPFSQFKSQSTPAATDNASSDNAQADTATQAPASKESASEPVVVPRTTAKAPAVAHNVTFPIPSQPAATARPVPAAGGSQSIVQVSATSRRGDAEALIAALQLKGYVAAIRQEPQDKLFHVQIGPFATKVEANAMRKRLDTDGYKAIVK